ncbi:MAG: NAD(P)/FAD-dependent oxidoreductase [Acidobacteriaceae bacterium]
MAQRTRVLILGGGFAGVQTAMELERLFPDGAQVEITLVSRDNFVLFTPMLHEVAASDLDITTIVNPIRKMLRHAQFIAADVESIDLQTKQVTVAHGLHRHEHVLTYDHLVLALGSVTNFYGLDGLEDRALTMKSLEDAIRLRNKMISHLEEADPHCASASRSALLTLVVAGGGFAGVETVAGVYDFMHSALRSYPNLKSEMLRIVLVHPGHYLLPELGEKLGRYTQAKLSKRGIEVHIGVKVTSISSEGLVLSDGNFIPTMFVVWTAGTSPSRHVASLPCENRGGRVTTGRTLAVKGREGVWALGDCASIPDGDGGFYPPTAQHALRQAKTVARNIAASIRGTPAEEFSFATIGQLAAIGRRVGVARVFGLQFSGFLAWWMWRTIYLIKLPRWEKRLHVALDWTLDLIFSKDTVQYVSFRAQGHSLPPAPAISDATSGASPQIRSERS